MKKDSPMSIHYSKYASTKSRVEYINRKRRNNCIKTIRVDREWERERERRSRTLPTKSLLFSPDGTQILSSSKRICVWEATSGELIAGPLAGEDESDALFTTYSPDGRYIIIASGDGIIRKWDALTNCLVWEREMDREQVDLSRVESAAFSPDAKSIVFGNNQGTILVLNVDTGGQDGEPLEGHTDSICCLAFSSDGKYFVSGSEDTTIIIWDMNRREPTTMPLKKHTQAVTTVNFSSDGSNIVSGSLDASILVWNAFTGEVLRSIKCENAVYSVTYSPDELLILAAGWWWMSMWEVVDVTAPPRVFEVHESILRVSFSPDSSRFVSVNGDCDAIQIWDASWRLEDTKPTFEEQGEILPIALSPGGEFIASGSTDGSIYFWNVLNGELVKKLKLPNPVISISFSPVNEKLIAFGSGDEVQVWDVTNDEHVIIGNHMALVVSVAFSPSDGKLVASGAWDQTIRIWDVECKKSVVGPLMGHANLVTSIAYSRDGTRLVSGSADETVRIWNPETGQLLSTLNGHSSWVLSVAYSFDGSRIVSGSGDKTILVWNSQNGEIVGEPITGHGGWLNSVCFSPDGERIVSGSDGNIARVWDSRTGQPLFPPFSGHTGVVSSVCFFPDGRHFATGSYDGTIRIWTLDAIANKTNWELKDDGWVVSENGKLMMWIPRDLHRHVCSHGNISILNRSFYVRLHFGTEQNTSRNIQF